MEVGSNWVRSDRGFYVGFTGRYEMEYREGDHILVVPVEGLGNMKGIYLSSARCWQDPYDREEITSEKQEQVARNIAAAMKRLRLGFRID